MTAFSTKKGGGGNPLFPPEDRAAIVATACQTPAQYGFAGQTHWSISSLRKALLDKKIFKTISWTLIQRTLRGAEIKPHKMEYYLFCKDPELIRKSRQICRLYRNPPKGRVLLCFDERTGTQALERPETRPMIAGIPFRQDFEYRRHGTVDLLAIREVIGGKVFAKAYSRHREKEFLNFMKIVRKRYKGKRLSIILDNLRVHKTPGVLKWLKDQGGMVKFIFLPKHASWLNQIELWFRELHQKCLKRLSVFSLKELVVKIQKWVKTYNRHFAHPYNWESKGFLTSAA